MNSRASASPRVAAERGQTLIQSPPSAGVTPLRDSQVDITRNGRQAKLERRWDFIRSCFLLCQLRDGGYRCQECGTFYESPRALSLGFLVRRGTAKDFTPANAVLLGSGEGSCGCFESAAGHAPERSDGRTSELHKGDKEETTRGVSESEAEQANDLTPSSLRFLDQVYIIPTGYPVTHRDFTPASTTVKGSHLEVSQIPAREVSRLSFPWQGTRLEPLGDNGRSATTGATEDDPAAGRGVAGKGSPAVATLRDFDPGEFLAGVCGSEVSPQEDFFQTCSTKPQVEPHFLMSTLSERGTSSRFPDPASTEGVIPHGN